jgi:hypothetical protein
VPATWKNPEVTSHAEKRSGSPSPIIEKLNGSIPAMASNELLCSLQSTKFAGETSLRGMPALLLFCQSVTTRSASRYGSGRSNTALMTLNIAVFAPMPKASVKTTISVNPGRFARLLAANRKSLISVSIYSYLNATKGSTFVALRAGV